MKTLLKMFGLVLCGTLIILSSCQDRQILEELARYEQADYLKADNSRLARKFYQHLDAVQIDSLEALCAPDVQIYYQSGDPVAFSDMVPYIKMFYEAFPDYTHNIEGIIAADDKVVARVSFEGTFENTFMNLEPDGEKFKYKGIQIFQFENCKVKKMWIVEDEVTLMTQLGLDLKPV